MKALVNIFVGGFAIMSILVILSFTQVAYDMRPGGYYGNDGWIQNDE